MTSLASYIHEYFDTEYGSDSFCYIYECSLKYLVKAISASTFHKRLKSITDKSVKVFRLGLISEGYYILNLKLFLVRVYALKRTEGWNIKHELRDIHLMKKDRLYISRFFNCPEIIAKVKEIITQIGGKKYLPTIAELKDLCIRIVKFTEKKLRPLINNLISTKLKFLIECGSIDTETVRCEFKTKMIQIFYWVSPYRKENLNHWAMSMIKPIKNHAINLINFYVTKKRARMYEENGVYKVMETSVTRIDDETDLSNLLTDEGETKQMLETNLAIQQVVNKYCITEKRSRAFKIMSGVYDEEFTSWLKTNGHLPHNSTMDNSDLQDRSPVEKFLKLVSKFVQIKWEFFKLLLKSVRESLSVQLDLPQEDNCYAAASI